MSTDKEAELADLFVTTIKKLMSSYIIVDGTIESVDPGKFLCDVTVGDSNSESTYHDVPLRVLVSSQASVIEIPKQGTACLISFRDGNLGRPQLLMVHEIDTLLITCDTVNFNNGQLLLKDGNAVFNNGDLGGLVKVEDLVTRMNKIESDINTLKKVFSSWTPVPNDGGAALKGASSVWASQQLSETQKSDLENTKIKQ